ncbi:hypothetical protein D1867_02990 [Acidianus infernus]|uniref:Peptidase A2 domain-containing protein n=1 Tax=Acidianus infernus TaxID=12915 RepID=A0A6A9QD43_ACIIN|nr:hypothetical protein [Acidianus infernus]MCY0874629.1 hypothetical protein [Acidianus infernus]MCY0884143.1 hypothetical protein [Acidianus infernus]MUM64235.1 hypothetical protein [Acidianus infernus]
MSKERKNTDILVFPFSEIFGNKVPLIDIFVECPSIGSMVKMKGLIDTGSRYTLLDKEKALYCFNDLDSRYHDLAVINGALTKRYLIKIKLGSSELDVPVSLFSLQSLSLPVVPEIILGREDFLEKFIVTLYKSHFITIYLD